MTADPPNDHSWSVDLVDPQAARRHAALNRHRYLLEEFLAALRWVNHVWAQAGSPAPQQPHLAAELDQAQAARRSAYARTLFGAIAVYCDPTGAAAPTTRQQNVPYALLFLRWERQYPREWREAGSWGSLWGTKARILASSTRDGVPESHQADVVDLIVAAVAGPYRCEDWRYACLARRVGGLDLRDHLAARITTDDPLPRLRARFLLHVLDDPEMIVRSNTWQRWLGADQELARKP